MASTLSWMDYSERERRRALDVIDLFRESDTRDELGIGSVRDAFADMLFPGTSTIQTRAKYLLFVPWSYMELERLRAPSASVSVRARREEISLVNVLAESDDRDGVIGIEARGELKRLPSNVYWLGLNRLGIREFAGSQAQYHRYLDSYYIRMGGRSRAHHAGEGDGHSDGFRPNWHAGIPKRPANFPREASLRLAPQEAEYLQERILASAPGTFLAYLVGQPIPFENTRFPWDERNTSGVPANVARHLTHARSFSEVMHGAALLYNMMLAEAADNHDLISGYRLRLEDWQSSLTVRGKELSEWSRREFWSTVTSEGARVHAATRAFIDDWLNCAISHEGGNIESDLRARDMISRRERSLKRDRARLHNRRALELWSGKAGTAQLTYRWTQAQRIVLDILEGLGAGDTDA